MEYAPNPTHHGGNVPVDYWYTTESEAYPMSYPPTEPSAGTPAQWGNLTQILWKNTKRVGMGCAGVSLNVSYHAWYVVGIYDPPGNVPGQYAANVRRNWYW